MTAAGPETHVSIRRVAVMCLTYSGPGVPILPALGVAPSLWLAISCHSERAPHKAGRREEPRRLLLAGPSDVILRYAQDDNKAALCAHPARPLPRVR